MHWLSLVAWVGLCLAIGAVGGLQIAPQIPNWYRKLDRPSFSPPNWVFAPVWTTLYFMMGLAAWLVWQAPPSPVRLLALALFLLQLALNFAWTFIFFRRHAIGAAFLEVVFLWGAIAGSTFFFAQISTPAAWLMVPYLAWVTFASILNGAVWQLN